MVFTLPHLPTSLLRAWPIIHKSIILLRIFGDVLLGHRFNFGAGKLPAVTQTQEGACITH